MIECADDLEWFILPDRNVCHLFSSAWIKYTDCGNGQWRTLIELTKADNQTRKCEQCLITLCSSRSEKKKKLIWRWFLQNNQGITTDWRKYLPKVNMTRLLKVKP
jgi:hypothetical protein